MWARDGQVTQLGGTAKSLPRQGAYLFLSSQEVDEPDQTLSDYRSGEGKTALQQHPLQ